jgi:hypothetical protein
VIVASSNGCHIFSFCLPAKYFLSACSVLSCLVVIYSFLLGVFEHSLLLLINVQTLLPNMVGSYFPLELGCGHLS